MKAKISPLVVHIFNRLYYKNRDKIRGKRNKIVCDKILLGSTILIKGNNNRIVCKQGGVLRECSIEINGSNNMVIIGENVSAVKASIIVDDENNKVEIGNGTKLCGQIELACIEGTTLSIGENCLFSEEIVIRTGDGHSVTDLSGRRLNYSKDVRIDNYVWVGKKVTINKGCIVGKNNVVGTGAIITKSVLENNVIIAGVPAKVVKRDIDWKTERVL